MCNQYTGALFGGLTGFMAGSQIQAGKDAAKASIAQAQALSQQAGQQQDAANAQAEMIRRAARRQAAQAEASLSASGVVVDAGTPLVINTEIERGGEYDALMSILGADRESAVLARESVALGRQAKGQRKAGYINAINTVMQMGQAAASAGAGGGWRGGNAGSTIKVNG